MVPARPTDANAPHSLRPIRAAQQPAMQQRRQRPDDGMGVEQGADALDAGAQGRDTDGDLPPVLQQAPRSRSASTGRSRRC